MIHVCQLTHHFGLRPVLTDIDLHVENGELIVLLGPNGSGKTTLLGCMAGTIWPVRGYVEFDGIRRRESVDSERDLRKRVVFLPDDVWLPLQHTGREFLLDVGRLYEIDELRLFDHADRLLKLFQLEEKSGCAIKSYSTGQRKKISLASALITEAPFLLLDEPFSGGLDPSGIGALKGVLKRLAGDANATVVMTTPAPELVEELAHRVAIIDEGRLVAYASPAEINRQAGAATFDDALQRLISPEATDAIATYFGDREKVE